MLLFFVNTFNLLSKEETQENEVAAEKQVTSDQNKEKKDIKKKIDHPFIIIVEYWGWALVTVAIISIIIQIYLAFLRKTYRYIITNRRCIFIGGILKRVERSVPYKKITDIQKSQNILERVIGIWNVQVFTPGTASIQMGQAKAKAELNFDGLVNSEELYEIINKHTQLHG
jgi:uncharacterized membrane protein YdbT with pleckstrin-like domain